LSNCFFKKKKKHKKINKKEFLNSPAFLKKIPKKNKQEPKKFNKVASLPKKLKKFRKITADAFFFEFHA